MWKVMSQCTGKDNLGKHIDGNMPRSEPCSNKFCTCLQLLGISQGLACILGELEVEYLRPGR